MWGEEGESEVYGERNMKTDITMEVVSQIDSQWEFAYDSGNSNWSSVTT